MKRYAIALLAPLMFTLPASAEWPSNARQGFMAECVEGAITDHPADKAQAFCQCAADKVGREFDSSELEAMAEGNMNQDIQHRLRQASESCSNELES